MPPLADWTTRALSQRVGFLQAWLRARDLGATAARACDLAEEAVQEARFRAQHPHRTFTSEEHYQRWLRVVAVNCVRDCFRRERRLRQTDEVETAAPPPSVIDPDHREALQWALAQIAPRERSLLERYYLEEHTYEEIGRDLGRSITWVWQRVRQARSQLRRLLEVQGVNM